MPTYYGWYGPPGQGPWPGGAAGCGVTTPGWPPYGGMAEGHGTGKGGGRGQGGKGRGSGPRPEWECRVCRTPNRQYRDRCRRCGNFREEDDVPSPTIIPEDLRAPADGNATPRAPTPPAEPAPGPAPAAAPPAVAPSAPAAMADAGLGPGAEAAGAVDTAPAATPELPSAAARQALSKDDREKLRNLKDRKAKLKVALTQLGGGEGGDTGAALKRDLESTQREIDKLDTRPIGVRMTKTEEALERLDRQYEHLQGVVRGAEDDKIKAGKQMEKLKAERVGLQETLEQLRAQLALHAVPGLGERERDRAEQEARAAAELGEAHEVRTAAMAEMALYIRDQAPGILNGTVNSTYMLKEVLEKLEDDDGVQAVMHAENMRRQAQVREYSADNLTDVEFSDIEGADAENVTVTEAEDGSWMHREARGRLRRGLAPSRRLLKIKLNKKVMARRRRV